mgnify:CR=1 FL=1
MSDDSSLRDKLRGGFGTIGKLGLLGGITVAAGVKKIKDTVVGDPPSPWRKALVFGSAALAIGYSSCEDEIDTAGHRTYQYLEGQQAQRIEALEGQLTSKQHDIDSLARENKELSNELQDLTSAYQTGVDTLVKENTELADKLNKVTKAYQAGLDSLADENADLSDEVNGLTGAYQVAIDSMSKQNSAVKQAVQSLNGRTSSDVGPDTVVVQYKTMDEKPASCWHPVQPGETLSEVSQEYLGSTQAYAELAEANRIEHPDMIPIGLPVRLKQEPCPANQTSPPDYTVIQRENQSLTADLSRVSQDVSQVKAYNDRLGNQLESSEPGDNVAVYHP